MLTRPIIAIAGFTQLGAFAQGSSTSQIHVWSRDQCPKWIPLNHLETYSSTDGLRQFAFSASSSNSHVPAEASASILKEHDSIWAFPPNCTQELGSINDNLCVYTYINPKGQGSLSIFTTPSLADTLTTLPAFKGCPSDDNICHSILASSNLNTFSGAWKTSHIPGKGIGMIAAKNLHPGDIVTAYTPTFMAFLESDLSTAEREGWWVQAISQLPRDRKDLFMDLSYVFGDPRVRVQDIVKANTFAIEVQGRKHLAIFAETSRLNHACNPNAQYVIHEDLLAHVVRVTRPIQEGEEITIAYTSPLEPVSTRHAHLQQGFHFTCTCPRCIFPSSSDATLSLINTLQTHLNDWSASSPGSPSMAEELLQIHRDEGLEGFMDVAYGFAALAYNAVGDVDMGRMYAGKAKEAILRKDGRWAPNLRIWNAVLEDAEGHWSFRRRL